MVLGARLDFVADSVRHQLLQPAILVLQLLDLTNLVDLQAAELLLPAIERLFADPSRPISSTTGIPISARFTVDTIWSTENRLRFIEQNPPSSDLAETRSHTRSLFDQTK